MASPFSIFRKNQKLMMVALAVLCMLAFVVATPLMQIMDSRGSGGEQVALTTKYGAISESELRGMRQSRDITNRLAYETMRLAGADPRLLRNGQIFGGGSEPPGKTSIARTARRDRPSRSRSSSRRAGRVLDSSITEAGWWALRSQSHAARPAWRTRSRRRRSKGSWSRPATTRSTPVPASSQARYV